jgi:hypothetical protein
MTLGVTGHRVLAEREKLAASVDRALGEIERAFPGRELVVLSALAEGADRLVAERVLRRPGGSLRVVLPMPRADYASDFATTASRREFDELLARAAEIVELAPGATREASYEAVGRHVVDHCDALIAVWDGETAQGRGGTGAIVARARARGLPLAWVHAGNRRPGTSEPTTLGAEQGRLSLEGF